MTAISAKRAPWTQSVLGLDGSRSCRLSAFIRPSRWQRGLLHRLLNEIEGLENPTSETLARWLWRELKPSLPELCEVTVRETASAGCVYRGKE